MTDCPACGRPVGKWDQRFADLKAGKQVWVDSPNEAKNAHHMAAARGLRVRTVSYGGRIQVLLRGPVS